MANQLTIKSIYSELAPINEVVALLAEETDAKRVADFARAVEAAKIADTQTAERQAYWGELAVWATRRLGEVLAEMPKAEGARGQGRPKKGGCIVQPPNGHPTLEQLGIEKTQAHRAQRLAAIPKESIVAYVAKQKKSGDEVTKAGLIRAAVGAHVGHNSGENEWYTPVEYIDAARAAMGSIDLDPASTTAANKVVKAKRFFTDKDNGLEKPWNGNVWLNPPYSQPAVGKFSEKLVASIGDMTQACVLVNNATETKWFQAMAAVSIAICFPSGRVKFWNPLREATPLQGQAVLYIGKRKVSFCKAFRKFGLIVETVGE